MSNAVTVESLFDALRHNLALAWLAGRSGGKRKISSDAPEFDEQNLVGLLNCVHPNRVQILGITELDYLAALRKNSRQDCLRLLIDNNPAIIVIADNGPLPDELRAAAEATSTPILGSSLPARQVIADLQYYLSSLLAKRTIVHGVFMEVMGMGVLLTGKSSVGKSELALELITRGHRLIADDAPELARIAPDILSGSSPPMLRDLLEVRGLGILNVRAMFGDSATKQSKYLRLIIHLEHMDEEELGKLDRLRGSRAHRQILGVDIPEIRVPVASGRNLAILVEAAVRNHMLSIRGYEAGKDLAARQRLALDGAAETTQAGPME